MYASAGSDPVTTFTGPGRRSRARGAWTRGPDALRPGPATTSGMRRYAPIARSPVPGTGIQPRTAARAIADRTAAKDASTMLDAVPAP